MDFKAQVKKVFLVSAALSCLTCYARPDYNLPLFAFAYLLWNQKQPLSQKARLMYLFVFTFIIDFVWICYWGHFWDSAVFEKNWAKGVQTFVLVISVINLLIKFGILIICFIYEPECKHAISADGFITNVKELFSCSGQSSAPKQ